MFCDISQCATKINGLNGSKVPQEQALKEQRENLWRMLQDLNAKANQFKTDYKLHVWKEVDNLIDSHISDFLKVTDPDTLIDLLEKIQTGASAVNDSDPAIQKLITQLKTSIGETIAKLETAK